jgi:hypothetical protein
MLELVDENWPGTGNDKARVAGRCARAYWETLRT